MITINKTLAAAILLLGTVSFARADDPDSTFDWSGNYFGVLSGYGWTDGRFAAGEDGLRVTSNHDLDDLSIGAFVGTQRQFENDLVFSVEADALYRSRAKVPAGLTFDVLPTYFNGQTLIAKFNWSGSARVRLGRAYGRWLPFGTVGIAAANFEVIHDNADPKTLALGYPKTIIRYRETTIGLTVGAGAEFALSDRAAVRAEYRYSDFMLANVPLYNWDISSGYSLNSHDVLIGLGYRF